MGWYLFFEVAILRHLGWMYWLCSFLVLSSYCGLVCSSDVDVLLTSKVQKYTIAITVEKPEQLPNKLWNCKSPFSILFRTDQQFWDPNPSKFLEVSPICSLLCHPSFSVRQKDIGSSLRIFPEDACLRPGRFFWLNLVKVISSPKFASPPLKKLPSQNSIAFQALFWKAMLNFRGVDLKHLPIISTSTNCLDTSLKW